MASGKKNARRLGASLVFLDESGLLLAPLVRRTWALRGHTPILYQRGRFRERASMIAAITVSPRRRKVGLYFSLHPNQNVTGRMLAAFLRDLRRERGRPLLVVWDRLRAHYTALALLRRGRSIHATFLPPYAPELNPTEHFWGYLKMNPLANDAAYDLEQLVGTAETHAAWIAADPALLRSFIEHTPLFLRLP